MAIGPALVQGLLYLHFRFRPVTGNDGPFSFVSGNFFRQGIRIRFRLRFVICHDMTQHAFPDLVRSLQVIHNGCRVGEVLAVVDQFVEIGQDRIAQPQLSEGPPANGFGNGRFHEGRKIVSRSKAIGVRKVELLENFGLGPVIEGLIARLRFDRRDSLSGPISLLSILQGDGGLSAGPEICCFRLFQWTVSPELEDRVPLTTFLGAR